MKSAKNFYEQSDTYQELKRELIKDYDEKNVKEIFDMAAEKLDSYRKEYAGIPKGEHVHTDGIIFPRAAMYLSMKEKIGDEAFPIIKELSKKNALKMGETYGKFTKTKGISKLFLKIYGFMAAHMFGEKNGFQIKFYDTNVSVLKFDITQCPYKKFVNLLNCPEIAELSCDADVYSYGNLKCVEFVRTSTLSKGADKCDFELRIRK